MPDITDTMEAYERTAPLDWFEETSVQNDRAWDDLAALYGTDIVNPGTDASDWTVVQ